MAKEIIKLNSFISEGYQLTSRCLLELRIISYIKTKQEVESGIKREVDLVSKINHG